MGSLFALAAKDLKLLHRDRFGLFWVALFPLLMALFFGLIFSQGGDGASSLKIAFTGVGDSAAVTAFYDQLASSEGLTVKRMAADSARGLVARGKLVAAVRYTDTTKTAFGFFGPARPAIEVQMDPSRRAEAGYLKGLVTQAYFQLLQAKMADPKKLLSTLSDNSAAIDSSSNLSGSQRGLLKGFLGQLDSFLASVDTTGGDSGAADRSPFGDPNIVFEDVAVAREGPRSSWEITFPQALQWALIGVAAAFAVGLVSERTRGTYLRLRLAPITRLQILAGKGLACFIACMLSCTVLLTIGIVAFDVHVSSPLGLAAAVLSSGFCFVGIMMMISSLGKTEQAVGGAGWAILLVMSMTGGGMVPLMFMPSWLTALGSISPVKWSILATEGAIWRGFGAAQMLGPIAVLLAFGAAGLAVGVFVLSRSDD
jgi:ABC-2 type transport system permease protein